MALSIKGLVALLGHGKDAHMPKQLLDTDRNARGAALHTSWCHVAAFGPDADNLTLLFPQSLSFSKQLRVAPVSHFIAREVVARSLDKTDGAKVIVGRGVFYTQGIEAVLSQATDDLVGVSLPKVWPDPIGLFGRDWYAAVMCSSYRTREVKAPRLVLRPLSLLTEAVAHVA